MAVLQLRFDNNGTFKLGTEKGLRVYGQGNLHMFAKNSSRNFSIESSEIDQVCETTDWGRRNVPSTVIIRDTKTNNKITFNFTHADQDSEGEETYGWNYAARAGNTKPCTLLIIND